MLASGFFNHIDGCVEGAAGSQHRIDNQCAAMLDIYNEFLKIGYRLQRLFVTVETDHADSGAGNQFHDTIQHTQTGS